MCVLLTIRLKMVNIMKYYEMNDSIRQNASAFVQVKTHTHTHTVRVCTWEHWEGGKRTNQPLFIYVGVSNL